MHKGRWDKVYEICLNSLGGLEDIAMKRRRNFILDQVKHQTNDPQTQRKTTPTTTDTHTHTLMTQTHPHTQSKTYMNRTINTKHETSENYALMMIYTYNMMCISHGPGSPLRNSNYCCFFMRFCFVHFEYCI